MSVHADGGGGYILSFDPGTSPLCCFSLNKPSVPSRILVDLTFPAAMSTTAKEREDLSCEVPTVTKDCLIVLS